VEILTNLWRFEAVHPEWEEGDDWPAEVAWWAARTPAGLVLIDPLVSDWDLVDGLVETAGGCAAVIRTCWWHQRTIDEARLRYGTEVWAREPSEGAPPRHLDRAARDGEELPGGLRAFAVVRDDEIGLWLAEQRALLFGDVMIRDEDGTLAMCPESWIARAGGHPALRIALRKLLALDVEHVLVSHGPLRLGGGHDSLARALQ
jgi:hypothetical protein